MAKPPINGQFSIAMSKYQRVTNNEQGLMKNAIGAEWNLPICGNVKWRKIEYESKDDN